MYEKKCNIFVFASNISCQKHINKKLSAFSSELYYATISATELNVVMNQKFDNPRLFFALALLAWPSRINHEALTNQKFIRASYNKELKDSFISWIMFVACSKWELIVRSSTITVDSDSPIFLQWIQGYICGLIDPLCRPFCWFMVLVDASIAEIVTCKLTVNTQLVLLSFFLKL